MKPIKKEDMLAALRSKRGPYDGHSHSTVSDGVLTTAGLARLGALCDIAHLGVCNHDFPLSRREADKLSLQYGLDVIPGVELNVVHPVRGRNVLIHLGILWPVEDDEELNALFAHNQSLPMDQYAKAMLQNLFDLGLDPSGQGAEASYQMLLERNPGCKYIGKGHVSQLLADTGLVSSREEAGRLYLGEHGERRAYVAKEELFGYVRMHQLLKVVQRLNRERDEAILVTLNHPFHFGLEQSDLEILINDFSWLGGHAVEVYYPKHDSDRVAWLQGQCRKHGLLQNVGSDYHYDAHSLVRGDPALFDELLRFHRKEWKPDGKEWW